MKRVNFNIKDRKFLILGLCLILVCVFTLSIAYAALNAVLTISGNAEVVASTWDIYLSNPRVTYGSVSDDLPSLKSRNSLEFSTTLNMPGDFYEFTVDVVNGGSIDAMIENIIKNPELTAEQAKYLNYVVTYQNGESIDKKQTLTHGSTMPIKVRVEYRRDISASDLPTGQTKLDLSLTLEYIQSDGTGSNVNNNGVSVVSALGNIEDIGTVVTIGDQHFYTIGTEGDDVKLLSKFNLYVGFSVTNNSGTNIKDATGMQNELARGYVNGVSPTIGTQQYSYNGVEYEGSIVEGYINDYKSILETNYEIDIKEARAITKEELVSDDIGCSESEYSCSNAPSFITETSYWVGSVFDNWSVWGVYSDGRFTGEDYYTTFQYFGVRPVIVISKDYFN